MAVVVTKKGKEITVNRHIGSTPTQGEPKYLGWGTNPAALTATVNDIAQFTEAPESRTTGSMSVVTTTNTNDTLQIAGTQTATATRAIQEAGIYDSATQPPVAVLAIGGIVGSAVSTSMLTNATFTPGNGNYVQARTEVLLIVSGSGSTTLTVTRAQNGTSAISTIAASDVATPGNPPGQTGVTGGNIFAHADFAVQSLANGDSITWTWKVQFA